MRLSVAEGCKRLGMNFGLCLKGAKNLITSLDLWVYRGRSKQGGKISCCVIRRDLGIFQILISGVKIWKY